MAFTLHPPRFLSTRARNSLLLLLVWGSLTACGHKGDLMLPESQPANEPAPSESQDKTD